MSAQGLWCCLHRRPLGVTLCQKMKASLAQSEVVTRKGKPVSVILPIKVYKNLLDRFITAISDLFKDPRLTGSKKLSGSKSDWRTTASAMKLPTR